jgi:dihydrofolate reductase
MRITLIAAVAENGVIGRDGDLPWRLPADLRHFQRATLGHAMLMGRRTYESTGVLPGRTTIVLSRSTGEGREKALHWARSYDEGLELARKLGVDELFVCGGAGIYRRALESPEAERMLLTRVAASPEGDTTFPEVRWGEWERTSREEHPADGKNPHAYAFEEWRRKPVREAAGFDPALR